MHYDEYDNEMSDMNEEGFWPSFTDIMMVIVMVFLLVTVVTIVKNWQLVSHLKTSMQAELHAKIDAEQERMAKMSLQDQFAELKNNNLSLKQKLTLSNEHVQSMSARMGLAFRQTETLQQRLNQLKSSSDAEIAQLQQSQQTMNESLQRAEEQQQTLNQQLKDSQTELKDAQKEWQAKLDSQTETLAKNADELSQLRSIEGKYEALDKKYQKLLRPERSSQGKKVVNIIYRKRGGTDSIGFKGLQDNDYRRISRTALHEALKALKKEHGDALYVKLVFPTNNGLSYNESMSFTREFQYAYDYYYQGDD